MILKYRIDHKRYTNFLILVEDCVMLQSIARVKEIRNPIIKKYIENVQLFEYMETLESVLYMYCNLPPAKSYKM